MRFGFVFTTTFKLHFNTLQYKFLYRLELNFALIHKTVYFVVLANNRQEELAKPVITREQIICWLEHFRTFDTNKFEHRRRFIDTFVNRIFLYDDKMVITFNYNKGTKTITFAELEASGILSISNIASTGEPQRKPEAIASGFLCAFFPVGLAQTPSPSLRGLGVTLRSKVISERSSRVVLQWCGMGILLSAVFVMSKYNKDIKKGKRFSKNEIIILVLGCIGASVADFCQKIFVTETGNGAAVLNFYSYAIGGVLLGATLILISAAKHNIKVSSSLMSRGNLLGYVGISAFLYVNSIFKTMAVGTGLSTAQIYPVLNGANLIASAILANILFKEKITLKSVAGMALAFIGVILINLF